MDKPPTMKSSQPPPAGELIAGKYEVKRMIGQGGMGSVWEAWHAELNLRVACKFIDSEFAKKKPEAFSRFRSEARAAAALKSKYVVDVFDFGTASDGRPYMVMEYLEGESLEDRIDRVGILPVAETLRIVGQTAKALSRAHAKGIVHRDLKPDNIFLVWDEEEQEEHVKVVDFGIAKFTQDELGATHATGSGALLGTPSYMAPEQVRAGLVDHQADLWGLGVVAYRCLTGHLPFVGANVGDVLVEICTTPIPHATSLNPALPSGVDPWFEKALNKNKAQRYFNSREMIQDLAAALEAPSGKERFSLADFPDESPALVPPLDTESTGSLGATITDPTFMRRAEQFWLIGTVFCVLVAGIVSFTFARDRRESVASETVQIVQPLASGEQTPAAEPVEVTKVEEQEPQATQPEEPSPDKAKADVPTEKAAPKEDEKATPSEDEKATPSEDEKMEVAAPKKTGAVAQPRPRPKVAPAPAPAPRPPTRKDVDIGLGY